MAYTPPASNAVDFTLTGGYTPPAGNSVDFTMSGSAAMEAVCVSVFSIRHAIEAEFVSGFSIRLTIGTEAQGIYGICVAEDHEAVYALRVLLYAIHEAPHAIGRISRIHQARYTMKARVAGGHAFLYDIAALFAGFECIYNLISGCESSHQSPYMIADTPGAIFEAQHALLDSNPVCNVFVAPYVLEMPTEQIDHTVSADVAGVIIELLETEISTDDDSFCLLMTARVADIDSWLACAPGDNITITVDSVAFTFIIDDRNRSRNFGEKAFNISGRSPAANLATGRAQPVTKTWGAITAKEVVNELCTSNGVSYDYQLLDWTIPDGVLASEGEYPIEIILKIARACGGIIQSTPSGTLVLKPKYPSSPAQYGSVAPALTLSDTDDFFSIAESKTIKPKYNGVYVMDYQSSSDTMYAIEQIATDPVTSSVTLAVWSYPFKETIDLKTSYILTGLAIESLGIVEEEKTETIEIIGGNGSVTKPVFNIISAQYEHSVNLGAVSAVNTAVITDTRGQSLLKVTYTTKYHKFKVINADDYASQIYTEEAA
jgi:hypothetical protein